jgi:hypothetical protein
MVRQCLGRGEDEAPVRLPASLLLAVSFGVVARRLRVGWPWLPLAVVLVLDLGVACGLLLRGARGRATGWFAVGDGHTVLSDMGSARSSTASRLADTTDIRFGRARRATFAPWRKENHGHWQSLKGTRNEF